MRLSTWKVAVLAGLVTSLASAWVVAAPLDALLTANPAQQAWQGEVVAGIDFMNEHFDFLGLEDDFGAPTHYQGGHVRAGLALTDHFWVDGGLWQRSLEVGSLDATLDTWQLAGQYRLLDGGNKGASIAVRAGLWGNGTDEVARRYNLLSGATQTSYLRIENPNDSQTQLDIITSLPLTTHISLGAFASIGNSKVDFDDVDATATYQGCLYNLQFGLTEFTGTLAAPCDNDVVVTRYVQPYDANDINIYRELRYSARFYQAGLSGQWQADNWRLRAGYVYMAINRGHIDDALESRGKATYTSNQSLLVEVAYRVWRNLSLSLAGQYFSNQFAGEIPMTYNSVTARHFDRQYGLLTGAAVVSF